MDDNPKAGWGFWTTVALLIGVVLYPLSAGPACWIYRQAGEPEWFGDTIEAVYHPLEILCEISPRFEKCAEWYVDLWWTP